MTRPLALSRITSLDAGKVDALTDAELTEVLHSLVEYQDADRKECQIRYYRPNSERARKVHDSSARIVACFGGNRCLPLDAPVLMADGNWKPLGAVAVGDRVMAADPVTGRAEPALVVATWQSGAQPVYKVEFSDGGWFEATADHVVPMYLGSGRKTTKGKAKKPHKRRLGDYLEPIMRRGASNPSKRISCISPHDIRCSEAGLPLHPYLLGALLGDGGLSDESPKFFNIDPAVLSRVDRHLREVGSCLSHHSGCNYGIANADQVRSARPHGGQPNRLKAILRAIGAYDKTAHHKRIPAQCFGMSRDDRKQLLAGLIDTDGSQDEFATASPGLAEDFVFLVRSLGGKATCAARSARLAGYDKVYESTRVYWRLNERLPLARADKQRPNSVREVDYTRRICRAASLSRVAECGDITVDHPAHCYITRDFVIVSNSGKTTGVMVEIVALATGVFPNDIRDKLKPKFRGPVNCRIVVESLTTTLESTTLPKLQFWKWNGGGRQGSDQGHWGWIPKFCLKGGSWEKAYQAKLRILTVLCRNPENEDEILGESTFQFMSHDQDPTDFASGEFHHILMDEPPRLAIWRENEARIMSVGGRLYLAMTWPDDPSIPVDWIHDEVYEKGIPGPGKAPDIECFELHSIDNPHIDQGAVRAQMSAWTDDMRQIRIFGRSIRFSNRIHPLFTDTPAHWSFAAGKVVYPEADGVCPETQSRDVIDFCHVRRCDPSRIFPTVFLLDPHPRKPHMFCWAQIDGNDDISIILEGALDASPKDVRDLVFHMEQAHSLRVADRLIDPNMGRSPSSASRREITWQDEFAEVGLNCSLADDSDVGRATINEYLQPDLHSMRPRLTFDVGCQQTIFQMKRYVWDNYRRQDERDLKQTPKAKHDDYPTLIKYLMNSKPTFALLHHGAPAMHNNRGYSSRTAVRVRA